MSAMKNIGTSLADVAAFMHEVELQQGYIPRKGDGRGIERMRHLAKHLQELPTLPIDAEVSRSVLMRLLSLLYRRLEGQERAGRSLKPVLDIRQ